MLILLLCICNHDISFSLDSWWLFYIVRHIKANIKVKTLGIKIFWNASSIFLPGDFVKNVRQINSQADLTSMSSFYSPSYLTIRSFLYIILIWNPCIFNLYNLCQTGSSYLGRKPHQCMLPFNEQVRRTHFLLLQPSIRSVPAQVILLLKEPPKLCIACHLVPLWADPSKITQLGFTARWCLCHCLSGSEQRHCKTFP